MHIIFPSCFVALRCFCMPLNTVLSFPKRNEGQQILPQRYIAFLSSRYSNKSNAFFNLDKSILTVSVPEVNSQSWLIRACILSSCWLFIYIKIPRHLGEKRVRGRYPAKKKKKERRFELGIFSVLNFWKSEPQAEWQFHVLGGKKRNTKPEQSEEANDGASKHLFLSCTTKKF